VAFTHNHTESVYRFYYALISEYDLFFCRPCYVCYVLRADFIESFIEHRTQFEFCTLTVDFISSALLTRNPLKGCTSCHFVARSLLQHMQGSTLVATISALKGRKRKSDRTKRRDVRSCWFFLMTNFVVPPPLQFYPRFIYYGLRSNALTVCL
jgi:hypothetical protein